MTEDTKKTNKVPATELELMSKVLELFPQAVIEEIGGEIVVNTKLCANSDGSLSCVGGP